MPRRRGRYSKLLEELRNNGGVPSGTGRTVKFHEYLTGQKKLSQTNKTPIEGRQLYLIGLLPFAVSVAGGANDPTERYVATMSAYSLKGLTDRASASEADFGINRIVGGEQNNTLIHLVLAIGS